MKIYSYLCYSIEYMLYNTFSFIYPTRPKNAAPTPDIQRYDNNLMFAQPKLNGSNCSIYTNGIEWKIFNRHNERLTNFNLSPVEMSDTLFKCERGRWIQINGEYMNKAKNDENGNLFNHKLVIFDTLVFNSDHLIGRSFQERVNLLDHVYGTKDSDTQHLYKISDNIYRVKTYEKGFVDLYNSIIKTDMMEGLVLKRKAAKLELGLTEDNNSKSMIKFRKPTKNYKY